MYMYLDVQALIPEFQANAQRWMPTKEIPQQKSRIFPANPTTKGQEQRFLLQADMLNHHNAIYTLSPKNEQTAGAAPNPTSRTNSHRERGEAKRRPEQEQGSGERATWSPAREDRVTGCFFSLSMPATVFAAISPLPPLPPIFLFLLLAPADAPGNETKTPTRFQENYPKKTPGISRGEP